MLFRSILFDKFLPFLGGILGAFAVYILVRKQLFKFTEKKKWHRGLVAALILLEVILCFMIPISGVIWMLVNKIESINLNIPELIKSFEHFLSIIKDKTGFDVLSSENISAIVKVLPKIGQLLIDGISGFVMNLVVLILFLYFMLISGRSMEKYLLDLLPFSEENKKHVVSRINALVISNSIGIPLLAIIQGAVALVAYFIFKVPSPLFFGLLTCFATVIPLLGTGLVWGPMAIYMFIIGHWIDGIGLIAYGVLVISNTDNLTRFILQKKLANTHPLITIFGVIIGLTIFGFMGIIFGPILISVFLVCLDMFKKQYLDTPVPATQQDLDG